MAQEPTFEATRFPVRTKVGSIWEHPVTGQTYVYGGTEKRSWRLVSDIENRVYTGAIAPDETTENLKHGDLWWDTEHMELRVYHKVILGIDAQGTNTYSEGVWISSTHPMMDPDEPDQMKQFGNIIVTPSQRYITEGSEFKFIAHLPYATAPKDEWQVSAVVTPSYLGSDPGAPQAQNQVSIDFDPDPVSNPTGKINGSLAIGLFPIGADTNVTLRVTITVQAKEGMDDEFYETYYQTVTTGGFTGLVELLPDHPPLVVNTLPFNELLSDTLKDHADSVLLDHPDYSNKVAKTIRFEDTSAGPDTGLILKSRIDGALTYDNVEYPVYEQVPIVALDAKTSGAKSMTLLFKYGDYESQNLVTDGFYEDTAEDDPYGVVRKDWQGEFESLGTVGELITNYRIAFYYDGEDDDTVDMNPNLWTRRFTDMGIVTSYASDSGGAGTNTVTGQFIGLTLTAENTKTLKETSSGYKRLYFACINANSPQLGTAADIVPSTKGYIDIEPFS